MQVRVFWRVTGLLGKMGVKRILCSFVKNYGFQNENGAFGIML